MLINLMVVDDSPVIQRLLMRIISQDPSIRLVATANNGQEAIDVLKHSIVDVMLLDLQMPVMSGLEAIPHLLKIRPKLKIIIVSSLAAPDAKCTIEALSLGAADYLEKPNNKIVLEQFTQDLFFKIKALGVGVAEALPLAVFTQQSIISPIINKVELEGQLKIKPQPHFFIPDLIAIASSTGGPRALLEVLGGVSQEFLNNNIILITQHIKDDFVDLLVENINSISKLHCRKAVDREELQKGYIYLAPSDLHMEIHDVGNKLIVRLSDAPPENFCRPSADPMFNSIAKLSIKALAIVLTGIGCDGLNGAKSMSEKGDVIIAQDKETSVVWGMPGAVSMAGICSAILPLHRIAAYIEKSCTA